jgi:hypothetical protein
MSKVGNMNLVGTKITDVHSKILRMGLYLQSASPKYAGYQYPGDLVGTEDRVTLSLHLDNQIVTKAVSSVETSTLEPWKSIVSEQEIATLDDVLEFARSRAAAPGIAR